MTEPWVLAIDLGTTDLKVGAVSLRGRILAHATSPIETTLLSGGGAVQDTGSWWRGICSMVRTMLADGAAAADDLIGIGITGQWCSMVPVGPGGEAVGPCVMWSDRRGARFAAQVMGGRVAVLGYSPSNLMRWIRITGALPSTRGADPLSHELYLREREPDIYAAASHLMEPVDYLGLRFTGRVAATPGSMIGSWLTDNRPGAAVAYVPELVRRANRDPARLPELLPTGSVLGDLLPSVAAELGVKPVPVVAGVADVHAAFLGSGAIRPYQAHVTISTTGWISCEVEFKRTDVFNNVASVPGVRPGAYVVLNNQETAGLSLKWVRDSLIHADYEELTALAGTVPEGSGGVMFTPWLNGERTPVEDRALRGAFLNLSVWTGRAHIVRAVLEGVAFNARWLFDAVERFVKRPLPSLRIVGGGAQSDLWCQIYADVLRRPMERVLDPRFHSLRGAGMFAAISLGRISIDEVPNFVEVMRTFEPNTKAAATYEPMYAEFKKFYSALHGSYARLNGRVPAP